MTFKPQVIPTAMRTMAPNNTTEKLADLVCGDLAYGLATRAERVASVLFGRA